MGRYPFNPFDGAILVYRGAGTKQKLQRFHLAKFSTQPEAGGVDTIRAAQTLGAAAITATTGITQPDIARRLFVTKSEAAIAGFLVVTGTDIADNVIVENIALATGTEKVSTKAFKTITSIVYPIKTDEAQTVQVGTDDCIGLPTLISIDPILKIRHNVTMITAWTLYNSSSDIALNMVDPTGYTADGEWLEILLAVAHE